MSVEKRKVVKDIREILLLLVVGLLMTVFFGYTKSVKQYVYVGSFTALLWVLLWKGNHELSDYVSRFINWLKYPLKSFFILFAATVGYTIGIVYLLVIAYEWLFDIDFGNIFPMLYSSMIVTIIITLFMHGRAFLLEWRQSAINEEKLKNESVTARYESLKNQVNPHFLFNSLNTLTGLVYEDQDKAVKFVKQLADVYRYVLETREQELVSENHELRFLDSYSYLLKIRFGDNLIIENKLEELNSLFPPLVLQMLIENAIKHNEVSGDRPLIISLYVDNDYIVVENNLQRKMVRKEESPGVGLSNIRSRYEFLTSNKVQVVEQSGKFIVKLPILKNAVPHQE